MSSVSSSPEKPTDAVVSNLDQNSALTESVCSSSVMSDATMNIPTGSAICKTPSSGSMLPSSTLFTAYKLAISPDSNVTPTRSPIFSSPCSAPKKQRMSMNSCSTPKKPRISTMQEILTQGRKDVDLHITSAMYNMSTKGVGEASSVLEIARQQIKSQNSTCLQLLKEVQLDLAAKSQKVYSLTQREHHLHREFAKLQTKVEEMQKMLSEKDTQIEEIQKQLNTIAEVKEFKGSDQDDTFLSTCDGP